MSMIRTRWAALGAAVAITLGGGGVGLVGALSSTANSVFEPMTPCRIIDTRPAFQIGPRSSPLGTAESHTVTARGTAGDCTIPTNVAALSMNVTAVGATLPTFLTIWETGEPMPNASSLNPVPGQPPTPNAVTTELSLLGQFDVYNLQGEVHVIIDVNGYYVDHHHDERYVLARPDSVRISAHEMRPGEDTANWDLAIGWRHQPPTAADQCVAGRIDLPVGMDVTGMSIVYGTLTTSPTVQVGLITTKATAGSLIGGMPPVAMETIVAPPTGIWEFGELSITVSQPTEVLAGYDYLVLTCTKDVFEIVGAEVSLSD